MLKIFSCSPGTCFELPNIGIIAGFRSARSAFFKPIMGPFDPVTGQSTRRELGRIDGEIYTSPKAIGGDRSCIHRQVSGELMIPSFEASTKYQSGYFTPIYDVAVGEEHKQYSHFISGDIDLYEEYPISGTTKYPYGTWIQMIKVLGRNVVAGYAIDKYSSATNHSVTLVLYAYSFSEDWSKNICKCITNTPPKVTLADCRRILRKASPSALGIPSKPTTKFVFNNQTQVIDMGEINRNLKSLLKSEIYFSMLDLRPKDIWGDLCQESIDSVNYCAVNVIAFIRELRDWRKLIPKIGKLLDPKTYANVYLWFRYGISLSIQDTKALATSLHNSIEDSIHSMKEPTKFAVSSQFTNSTVQGRNVSSNYRYKIAYDPYPNTVMHVIRELKRWGLYPTYEFSWDMVPYSFVIDWLLPLNDVFHEMDTRLYSQYFNVQWVCRSQKHVRIAFGKDYFYRFNVVGEITQTMYQRSVRKTLDLPRIRLDTPTGFRNYAELTALIVQRKR